MFNIKISGRNFKIETSVPYLQNKNVYRISKIDILAKNLHESAKLKFSMQCRSKIYTCLCVYPSYLPLPKAWSHGGRQFLVTVFREARRFRMGCKKQEIINAKIYAVLYLRWKFCSFDKEFPSYASNQ